MKETVRRYLDVGLLILITALSVAIFIFRDKLTDVGEVGYIGLFMLCFLANTSVLLPAPSLMIAASCALILNPILVAVVASLGSTTGELVGYTFGKTGSSVSPKFGSLLNKLNVHIKNPSMLVFVLALLPLPLFDVAGIYSGAARMRLSKFYLLCFAGKLIKMLVYTHIFDLLDWAMTLLPDWVMALLPDWGMNQ